MTVCKTPVNCIDRRDCVERDCENFSELLRQRLVSGTFSGCAFVFAGDRKEKTDPCGAGGKLSGDHGFILSAVYKDGNESAGRRRNLLPDFVAASHGGCDCLCGDPVVWAVFPQELIYYVRQYTSEVQMPYGREMLEASWEWNWDTHPIYKIMREDTIDLDALSPLLTEYNCQYLILNKSVPYTGDPQKNGLTKIADIEAYELYRNEAVEIAKKKTAPVTCGNPVA